MHEGMHMVCLESECTGGRENCKKISKRMQYFKKELIGEMTEKYEYHSTVPRTFVQDIVAR